MATSTSCIPGAPDDFLANATCIGTNVPPFASGVSDTSVPPLGQVYYYLGQLENNCAGTLGEGPTGSGSDGVVHVIRECD